MARPGRKPPVDEHNNAVSCPTGVFLDSDDNIIVSQEPEHLISTIGVSDLIIIHAPDATLICAKDQAQRVKEMLAKVKEKYGENISEP